MRRLGIVTLVLLLVLFGFYSAAWFFVADRMTQEISHWAEETRPRSLDASWSGLRVGGYPLAFRVEASEVRLRDLMRGRELELRAPIVSARARPWNFAVWEIEAPAGLTAFAGPASSPRARLTADAAEGGVVLGDGRKINVKLDLEKPTLDAGEPVAAREATIAVSIPEDPPQTHTEPALSLAVEASELRLPQVPPALPGRIDELAFDIKVMGPVPDLPPREAAAAWRDAGGTIELDKLAVRWGELGISGSGTLALDREMQPEGAFSGALQGSDKLMAVLRDAGLLGMGDMVVARLALSLLSKPGPDGKPQIAASFRVQDGELFLGPARLGRIPRIEWE